MKTKTHFAFRIDAWDAEGNKRLSTSPAFMAWPFAKLTLMKSWTE
jgi:hypothetical protein